MALAQDLMGLGMSPSLAATVSEAGTGPVTASLATNAAGVAGATAILGNQSLICVTTSGSTSTCGLKLPTLGGNVLVGDPYIISNAGATTFTVFGSTGVAVCVGGSNGSAVGVGVFTSLVVYPVNSTQWVGVRGS